VRIQALGVGYSNSD